MGNPYTKYTTAKLLEERQNLQKLKKLYTYKNVPRKSDLHYVRLLIGEQVQAIDTELVRRHKLASEQLKERQEKIVCIN